MNKRDKILKNARCQIQLRISEAEKKEVRVEAKKLGLKISQYLLSLHRCHKGE